MKAIYYIMSERGTAGILKILLLLLLYLPAQEPFKFHPTDDIDAIRSTKDIDVTAYNIELNLNPESAFIAGKTIISITGTVAVLDNITLDIIGLTVDSVFRGANKLQYTQDNSSVTAAFDEHFFRGDTGQISIYYSGYPQRGIYIRNNYYGNPVIYSHSEPYDARYWFPCKDDPEDKAFLQMHVTVPDMYQVLSNGRLILEKTSGEGTRSFLWEEQYPIATYLISVSAAPFTILNHQFEYQGSQMPVLYYAYPEDAARAEESLGWTVQMLGFYSDYIGIYPFMEEKYAMSEVPFREAGAMENQTATTMGENVFDREDVIAHELAHQWWGDALTPKTFADIWLNEGFASFFDALFTEYKYGRKSFEDRMVQMVSRIIGDGSMEYPIYNPPERFLFGSAVYLKGAWVLYMLRNEVGNELFRQICRRYYERYTYKNVTTNDFIAVCEEVYGSSLQQFFDQWLMYSGMPVLHGSWIQSNGITEITITQIQPEPQYQFNLELLLKFTGRDSLVTIPFFNESHILRLTGQKPLIEVIIDPNHRILNSNNSPVFHIPKTANLLSTYPNPFNGTLHISYQLPVVQNISLAIYNLAGQKVANVYKGRGLPGINNIDWQGINMASGIYFCRLTYRDGSDIKKIILVK